MLASLLQTGRQSQKVGFVVPAAAIIETTFGLPSVSVPVLSTTKRVHFFENLESFGVPDQHPRRAPRSSADHNRHRRRQDPAHMGTR